MYEIISQSVAALIPVAFGALLGIFAPILSHRALVSCLGPRLTVAPVVLPFTNPEPFVYVRLCVCNLKGRTAGTCRAFVSRIEWHDGHKWIERCDEAFPLIVAYDRKSENVPVPLGVPRHFDVACISISESPAIELQIRTSDGKHVLQPLILKGAFAQFGTYRFTTFVTADDIKPVICTFHLHVSKDQWPPIVCAVDSPGHLIRCTLGTQVCHKGAASDSSG